MKTDIEIAREYKLEHINTIGEKIGLAPENLKLYGDYKAKISMAAIRKVLDTPSKPGKCILVSAITPTAAGEGKTTTSIGLTQGLARLGKKAIVALREPSLGPVFGIKGGAAGGGYSQVLPMEDINLHFTGDMHAITAANNLISAAVDNHLHFGNELNLHPRSILWRRALDMNDRALRNIISGIGGKKNGVVAEAGFDITAASEIMAILCLSISYSELKNRIDNILVGFTYDNKPVTVKQLGIGGAAAALLREALLPNLVQTGENVPAFVHGGPFANIAQGANSIMATKLALQLSDYTVTEAGFGFDLGAEKFFDIVSPYGGFRADAVVLVATVRALKMHGGVPKSDLQNPNAKAVAAGGENLEKHLENIHKFGVPAVVAINRFPEDTDEELNEVANVCKNSGIACALATHCSEGGKGAEELASRIVSVLTETVESKAQTLYSWESSIEDKICTVAREIYGAEAVDYTKEAKQDIKRIKQFGYQNLPVCIAKTQSSLSDNPKLLGRPKDFLVTVRRVITASGAGFLVPLTGDILRMPGLPRKPAAESISIDDEGNITGLF